MHARSPRTSSACEQKTRRLGADRSQPREVTRTTESSALVVFFAAGIIPQYSYVALKLPVLLGVIFLVLNRGRQAATGPTILEQLGLKHDAISLRITGCPNGCARPYLAEIGFVGRAPGKYALYLGASYQGTRLNRLFAPSVTLDDAVGLLTPVLKRYALERQDNERFGDWCDRVILPADATFHSPGTRS